MKRERPELTLKSGVDLLHDEVEILPPKVGGMSLDGVNEGVSASATVSDAGARGDLEHRPRLIPDSLDLCVWVGGLVPLGDDLKNGKPNLGLWGHPVADRELLQVGGRCSPPTK